VEFNVLGPLEICSAGGAVTLTGPKRRALLARLIVAAGEALSIERLVDELWSGDPPRSAMRTLPTFVYQLRRRYGIEELQTMPGGYVLNADPHDIDARRFEATLADTMPRILDDPSGSAIALHDALAMWRGDAYEEFADESWARGEAARLDRLRLDAVEAWAAAALRCRATAGLVGELESWTARHPLRESLWLLQIVALATEGRKAEALRAVESLRGILRDELAVSPGAEIIAIENAIIRDEPLPEWSPAAATAPPLTEPVAPMRRPLPRVVRAPIHGFTPPPDRLVGRGDELAVLTTAFEDVVDGFPRIAIVTGEPGIGKSRLLDEFTPRAIAAGAQVLTGSCQEGLGVPYLPIATALRPLRVSEPVDEGDARLQFFLACSRALLDASALRATVLVVEDVHWADDATLALLRHIAAVVSDEAVAQRSRVMLVLTSRVPEPLSAVAKFLDRLDRDRATLRIPVDELPPLDCRELIHDWLGAQPSRAVVESLMRVTGGNPLVLRSTLRRILESGAAIDHHTLAAALAPTDLDAELWRRTDGVSSRCVEMLINAAILGSGERLETLAMVCDFGLELEDLLDESVTHQILVTDDEHFWFDHPQLRQLLYHSTRGPERRRRHLEIGDRLRAGGGVDVTTIAHHFLEARDLVPAKVMLDVAGSAADRAAAIGAWTDAARYAAAAVEAAAALDLPDEEIAAYAYRAGRGAMLAREIDAATKYLSQAAEMAKACGALALWGRTILRLVRHWKEIDDPNAAVQRGVREIDAFFDIAGSVEAPLRAELHALKAELCIDQHDFPEARREAHLAEDLADGVDDDELQVKVAFAKGLVHFGAMEPNLARQVFLSAYGRARDLADPNPAIWCLSRDGLMSFVVGDLVHAEEVLETAIDAGRAADNEAEVSMAAAMAATVAFARGRLAIAQQHAARAERAYREVPLPYVPGTFFPVRALVGALTENPHAALDALRAWDEVDPRRSRRYRPLIDALLGDLDAANRALDAGSFRLFTAAVPPDPFLTGAIAAQVELGALTERTPLIDGPLDTLVDLHDRGCRFTLGWPVFIPHVIALAYRALGEESQAEKWFATALEDATSCGAPIALARTAHDYAAFLESRGDAGARRAELRGIAREALSNTSMPQIQPADVSGPRPSHSALRIVLVSDLVSSTQINDRIGDAAYLELLREHDSIIRTHLVQHDGVEFKHTGDGIGAWFFSVDGALRCATEVQREFATRPKGPHGEPWRVRTALAAGEPQLVGSDLFGMAVTIAFRVTDCAAPGEVLVTADVAGLARGLPWAFEGRGSNALKGVRDPVELFAARPTVARVT
jgi:DNA-binding SARP family transcriptional activator/class 3 adenylate cyclase